MPAEVKSIPDFEISTINYDKPTLKLTIQGKRPLPFNSHIVQLIDVDEKKVYDGVIAAVQVPVVVPVSVANVSSPTAATPITNENWVVVFQFSTGPTKDKEFVVYTVLEKGGVKDIKVDSWKAPDPA